MKAFASKSKKPRRERFGGQRGFSLVELMVGVGVGLLSTVVIATILARSEQQKRSSSSGSDAQIAGALALNDLERSIKDAGYGLTTEAGTLGCTLRARFAAGTDLAGAPANLEPVRITPGKDDAPPTITVMRSTASGYSLPAKVKAPLFNPDAASGSVKKTLVVSSTLGMSVGDLLAVVSPPAAGVPGLGTCMVFQASALGASLREITRTPDTPWNGTGDLPKALDTQYVVNLGALEVDTFSVARAKDGGGADTSQYQLSRLRYNLRDRTSSTQVIQTGVVDMRAYYGRDTDDDGIVDAYDTNTPTTSVGWTQVKSVRIVLLTRGDHFEKDEVTTTEPVWNVGKGIAVDGAEECGDIMCVKLNPAATDERWKHYRYKVFDIVVPMRNQLWRSDLVVPAAPSEPAPS